MKHIKLYESFLSESTDISTLKELQTKVDNFSKLTKSTANTIAKFVESGQIKIDEITVKIAANKAAYLLVDGKDWNGRSFYDSWYKQQNDPQILLTPTEDKK
jgi:hypothetical protein